MKAVILQIADDDKNALQIADDNKIIVPPGRKWVLVQRFDCQVAKYAKESVRLIGLLLRGRPLNLSDGATFHVGIEW